VGIVILWGGPALSFAAESPGDRILKPAVAERSAFYDPIETTIEGWTVAVDPKLFRPENAEAQKQAFKALANHLQRVEFIVPEDRLAELKTVRIWLDGDHPRLRGMQYHPSRGWLMSHGHDPRLAKHVHI